VNEVLLSSQILVLSYVAGLFFMTLKFMPIQILSILTGISKTGNWTETWTIQIVPLVLAVGERSSILDILIFCMMRIYYYYSICPAKHFSDNNLYAVVSCVLATLDIKPPVNPDGKPLQLKPEMTSGLLS